MPLSIPEAERLAAVRAFDTLTSEQERLFASVCRTAKALFDVPYAFISLVDEHRICLKAGAEGGPRSLPRVAAFCADTILGDGVHVVADAWSEPRLRETVPVRELGARFYAGAPLRLRPGLSLGALCLLDTEPRRFSAEDRRRLQDLAEIAIVQFRQHEATAAHERELARRRESEGALEEANRRLTRAEAMAHVGHWHLEGATGRRRWSEEVFRIYGLAPQAEALAFARILDLYHPDDRPRVAAVIQRAERLGESYALEARVVRPDGETRIVLLRGTYQIAPDGCGTVAFGTVMDVTEIRLTEQRLRDTSAVLMTTLDAMDQGLLMLDAAGVVRVCNAQACALLDLPPAMMAAHPTFASVVAYQLQGREFLPSGHAGPSADFVEDWLASDAPPRAGVYERVRPDGRLIEVRTVPLPDGGVVRTYTDVTQHRRAEAELHERTSLLKATLENMSQGLCMFDAEARLMVWNQRYLEIFDLRPDQLRVGMSQGAIIEVLVGLRRYKAGVTAQSLHEGTRASLLATRADPVLRELADGRIIAATHSPMPGGGWVATFEDVTERRLNEGRIAHMACHDALTGLPNRTLFHERLDRRLAEIDRQGGTCALVCLDLDRFKSVNDTFGHLAGDALLREVGRRLRAVLCREDTVARLGGDEFAVLLAGPADAGAATAVADRLIAAMQAPICVGEEEIETSVSIGIALVPDHGTDGEALFKRADLALYKAKAQGRNLQRVFEPAMDAQAAERRSLEFDLRRAIEAGEITLHFQPQVYSAGGATFGFEALARWTHPQRGAISPATFIPLAEETGLIVRLGERVLHAACREAAGWERPLKVAVNLSPRQFVQGDLPDRVLAILVETGLPPSRLELEITETVLINDVDHALGVLRRLKALGITIAMDDFGTGYSSLATLHTFPFDKIKIDRSFVGRMDASPQAGAIVRAVLGLGRSLGIDVLAEGVETAAQREALAEAGCAEMQGYLVGRPQPIAAFADLVRPTRRAASDRPRGPRRAARRQA